MRNKDDSPSLLLNRVAEFRGKTSLMRLGESWFKTIEDFSTENLIYGLDQLPALSRLVQVSTELYGTYYAGL